MLDVASLSLDDSQNSVTLLGFDRTICMCSS